MPLWQLYYHAVWATQYRESRISSEVEPFVYDLLKTKARALDAKVFALNGMPDHVHLVFSIHPKLAPAVFLGTVKGYSSNRLNHSSLLDRPFFWQDEYAIFSTDAKRLPHHTKGTVIPVLERTSEETE